VFDLTGKKIYAGQVAMVTDTSLQLEGKSTPGTILVSNIGFIQTKRSIGHNVVTGFAIGATVFSIFGAATAEPDAAIVGYTAAEGAAAGMLIGATAGVAVGGITALFKKSETFSVDGDTTKWKAFQLMINKKQANKNE
jgi:hypothetical protein